MNPWHETQVKLDLPKVKKLFKPEEEDLQTLETLEAWQNEPLIDLYREPNDETDYAVRNGDGTITRVSECVTINGIQWWVFPGHNKIPKSIYEFLMQAPEQGKKLPTPALDRRYLGVFR